MKKTLIIFIFIMFVLGFNNFNSILYGNNKKLDIKYEMWKDLTHYIITPLEIETFDKLTNNRERDTYIDLFWKLRDPTEGTPDNEYKTELLKRFKHVNRYFKYGAPGAGWKSDRGKIYMLLGPPVTSNEIFKGNLNPVLIWSYHGGVEKGLPTMFNVVFYKKSGIGAYRIYVPTVDGPAALLVSNIGQIDPNNHEQIYQELHKIEPAVAEVSFSLIPGEARGTLNPSLQGLLLMQKIYELPKKNINLSYAKNFLNFKGVVKTTALTNYIDIKGETHILKDPILNLNFVHFALRPKQVSVNYSADKDKYYFNYNLIVNLKKEKTIVYTYKKNIPYYCSKEDMENKLSHGVVISDYFPVLSGSYKLTIVLQNSVNKEISYFEKKINIKNQKNAIPKIFGPLMSYRSEKKQQTGYSAFNIMGQNIKIDPKQVYSTKDSIYSTFFIDLSKYKKASMAKLEIKSIDEKRPYIKKYKFEFDANKNFYTINQKLEKLKYGNYRVKLELIAENKIINSKISSFVVSPLSYIAHPPVISKFLKQENSFLFFMMMAGQYNNINNKAKAEYYFERAIKLNSFFPGLIKMYASFLLREKKLNRMFEIVKNLKGKKKDAFEYYSLTGRALYYKNKYKESIHALIEANKIYDSDTAVLNTLGFAMIKDGNIKEAKKVLLASLRVNKNQNHIRAVLTKLNKNEHKK